MTLPLPPCWLLLRVLPCTGFHVTCPLKVHLASQSDPPTSGKFGHASVNKHCPCPTEGRRGANIPQPLIPLLWGRSWGQTHSRGWAPGVEGRPRAWWASGLTSSSSSLFSHFFQLPRPSVLPCGRSPCSLPVSVRVSVYVCFGLTQGKGLCVCRCAPMCVSIWSSCLCVRGCVCVCIGRLGILVSAFVCLFVSMCLCLSDGLCVLTCPDLSF